MQEIKETREMNKKNGKEIEKNKDNQEHIEPKGH